ncbi:MAG: pyridoxamine 5'-phosphate oxidase family protein [Anaerolineales bacterium]
MTTLALPPAVEAVFNHFMTCEFTTLGKGGVPITWPTLPIYWPEHGQFVIASPLALSQKAANVRRDPRVALLFSNPTGSGLADPPAVLVQGDGKASDEIVTGTAGLDPQLLGHLARQGQRLLATQPGMRLYLANPLTRYIMGWYFVRVFMVVRPRRLTWWDGGDFQHPAHSLEVSHVDAA